MQRWGRLKGWGGLREGASSDERPGAASSPHSPPAARMVCLTVCSFLTEKNQKQILQEYAVQSHQTVGKRKRALNSRLR